MRLRNISYFYTIIMFPFLLILWILISLNMLKSDIYFFSGIVLSFIYLYYFIVCLFCTISDIKYSNQKWNVILLIFFPFIYIPYFYGKYISQKDSLMCNIIAILNIILIIVFKITFDHSYSNYLLNNYKKYIKINEDYTYLDKSNLFTIDVDKNYVCNNDLGEYDLTCEDNNTDSFIGIYLYERDNYDEKDLLDILNFHIEQTISYIKENNYEYRLSQDKYTIVKYNDMIVYLDSHYYEVNDTVYYLIIIKETKTYQDNKEDFERLVKSIKFKEV